MKLVLLEALIVMIAMRAILSLIGHAPPWPSPVWDFFAGMALIASVWICVDAARRHLPHQGAQLVPPHIPLDRIGPYREESVLVRLGPRGQTNIHLN